MKKIKLFLLGLVVSLFCFVPVHADNTTYVIDQYGLLTESEIASLEASAQQVSSTYQVGVYVRIEDNHDGYSSIEDYAESLYTSEDLGIGADRDCIVMVITMSDRKYDIMAHGSTANAAFTDYGKTQIGNKVVSSLSNGSYYDGFNTFINECSSYLSSNANGSPVDTWIPDSTYDEAAHQEEMNTIKYICTFGAAPLIALIICFIIKARNKTAGIEYEAASYVPKNGMKITGIQDIFLYRTESVTHIDRSDHGGGHMGGTSINSGGFSHSSGSF